MLERGSAYRWPALATAGPAARVVVLRELRRAPLRLSVYTDVRTAKVEQLRTDPRAELLFFDRDSLRQLRVAGRVTVHHGDDVARQAWGDRSHLQEDYARLFPPGSPSDADGAGALSGDGFDNFAVLRLDAESLDWLQLSREGHRRARFHAAEAGWDGSWVVP
ncbi:hypothetical protein ABI59_05980 [Acidobacteria bacterium Mor1]|nr:hypothetical protein ABI59_05980 [Acidobacteria bacterium Mor1]